MLVRVRKQSTGKLERQTLWKALERILKRLVSTAERLARRLPAHGLTRSLFGSAYWSVSREVGRLE